ncbi:MAG: thiamine biosynthesis lipoprotein [Planctomycetota bacterium]|jgi:thiamine biosynthesis lipoprotein
MAGGDHGRLSRLDGSLDRDMWTTFSWASIRLTVLLVAGSCVACASFPSASPATATTIYTGNPQATATALQRYEFEAPKLGTLFRIVLFADDPGTAEAAASSAFQRVDELNGILSDYDEYSELSQLSAQTNNGAPTGPVPVSKDLYAVLDCAQSIALQTGGAFDITVGPTVQLWRRAMRQERMPTPSQLENAAAAIGCEKIQLHAETRSVSLLGQNMRLDLGGIAKGYILDEANAVLVSHGITRALLDAGGDLLASGAPPGQLAWQVQIDTGEVENQTRFALVQTALATSGDTFQFAFIDGKRSSHIVDPRTRIGLGLSGSPAASVHATSAMVADAWASALCVLGAVEGIPLVEATPNLEARYVQGRVVVKSSGFEEDL